MKKNSLKRALQILNALECVGPLYKELDSITDNLVKSRVRKFAVGRIELVIIDNFKKKNTVFRATALRRFEIQKTIKK